MQIGVHHLYSDILELVYYLETKLNIISIWRRTIMKTTNNDFLSMVGVITTIVYCLQARWLVHFARELRTLLAYFARHKKLIQDVIPQLFKIRSNLLLPKLIFCVVKN